MSYFYNLQHQLSSSTSAVYIFLSSHSLKSSQTSHLGFLKCPYLLCWFPLVQSILKSHIPVLFLLVISLICFWAFKIFILEILSLPSRSQEKFCATQKEDEINWWSTVFFPGPISSFIHDLVGKPTALLTQHINNKQTKLTCSIKYDSYFITFVFHSFLLGTVPYMLIQKEILKQPLALTSTKKKLNK